MSYSLLREAAIGLVTGGLVGAVFAPPAPGTLGGVLGVVGIWLGWLLISIWRK